MKNQLKDALASVIGILTTYQTFELGELSQICKIIDDEPLILQSKSFDLILYDFLSTISEESRKRQINIEHIGLIIMESLIFNLYIRYNKNASNSFYNTSSMLSTSQISVSASDQSMMSMRMDYDEMQSTVISFLEEFVSNDKILKKFKIILERHQNKSQNQRYMQILLETLDYILKKESKNELKKQNFQKNKAKLTSAISSHMGKEILKTCIHEANEIIFSNKLNRIFYMLTEAPKSLHFALHRIYFMNKKLLNMKERRSNKQILKYFQNTKQTGVSMVYNISKYYVDSIGNMAQLFEETKNPLYLFITSYFVCFAMPTFRSFIQIINKCCKIDYNDVIDFYKSTQSIIQKELLDFIESLSPLVLQFLHMLYLQIQDVYGYKPIKQQKSLRSSFIQSEQKNQQKTASSPTAPVKKLLLYSFLIKPQLIEMITEDQTDMQKYEQVCNLLLNLFFVSSLKRYSPQNTPLQDYQLIHHLTETISNKLDEKIIYFNPQFQQEDEKDLRQYSIEDPMLSSDYEQIYSWIKELEFTPKDLREFQMEEFKPGTTNVQTTWGKNRKQQPKTPVLPKLARNTEELATQRVDSSESSSPREEESMDLLTWMTVGGTRNYQQGKSKATERKRIKLGQFETFPKHKLQQVGQLYQEYKQIVK